MAELSPEERFQQSLFDAKAEHADARIMSLGERDNRNHAIKARRIQDDLAPAPGDRILEVGTGSGLHASALLAAEPEIDYVGIDLSSRLVERARERLKAHGRRIEVHQANANALPFEPGSFDGVFCAATLHHMAEPGRTIAEMTRMLRPGGRMVFMEPNCLYPSNVAFMVLLREDRYMYKMQRRWLLGWMEAAGLVDTMVENLIYTPPKPKALLPLFDWTDRTLGAIPGLRRVSLMLAGRGVRPRHGDQSAPWTRPSSRPNA